jgi:predicted Zn-dependent peptidase
LGFKTGDVDDPFNMPGLSGFIAGMLNEGTTTRSSQQIANEVDRIGGSLGASAGSDNTIVAASALSNYSSSILQLMADVVLNPSFPESEITLNKQNALQGLQFQRAQPPFLADERLSAVIYGQNPYSRVGATAESINQITRDKLVSFQKQTYIPNNAVLVVVGDVDKSAVLKDIENLFGKWQKGTVTTSNFPAPPVRTARTIYVVDRPDSAQSNIVLANLAINRTSPDYFAVQILRQILGGGASSRLFNNLREEKGYTYGAYSSVDARRLAGTFESTAEVRTDVTGASLKEFFYELDRIRKDEIPAQELADAKNFLTGVFPIQLETQEGLTGQIVSVELNGLPADYLKTYRERLNAVTAADVKRVANQYITPDKIAIVIVGDAAKIQDQIKPYSDKIEYFDTMGKAKEMSKPMTTTTTGNGSGAAKADGTWTLAVSSPQGDLPLTMTIKADGDKFGGSLTSPVGDGTITGGSLSGNAFTATGSLNFQGTPVEVKINGTIEGDSIKGNVTASIPGVPELPFTGKRAK